MNKIKENWITISPAYGRDYKSAKAARSDFDAGKDFKMESIAHGSGYCSKADFEKGLNVQIRYDNLKKVTIAKA